MNTLKTTLLLTAMMAAFLAIGNLFADTAGAVVGFIAAILFGAHTYWYGLQNAVRTHQAKPADFARKRERQLIELVNELARNAGIPTPRVFVFDSAQPNAFAAGRGPSHSAIIVSTGLLACLDWNEIAGVIAHEQAHIKNRDALTMTVASGLAGVIAFLAGTIAMLGLANRRGGGIGAIVFGAIMALGALVLQAMLGRSREYVADRDGAAICGHPLWIARALRRMSGGTKQVNHAAESNPALSALYFVNPLSGGWVARMFSTHPPVEKRIRRLERMTEHGGTK
jgi:heat shock protein HtpX